MSKVLKFIVNLVVLLSIAVAAALLVPPLLGVDTVINDNSNIETNLPVGAVAYGKQVDTEKLNKEDKIIYIEGSAQYVYEIQDMDTTAGVYKVKDVYNKNNDAESVTLQDKVSKAVITVPFIGYAAIALQSKTGLMVVGAVIVLLIILFILSEVLRRDDDDEDDEEEEEELSAKERRRLKKEEKRRRKLEKKGLLEEDDEEEEQEETDDVFVPENISSEDTFSEPSQELQGFDEAMKDAMTSIASGIAQVSEPENVPDATVIMPDAEEIEKAVQEAEETTQTVEEPEEQENTAEAEVEAEQEEALEMDEKPIGEEIFGADEEQVSEEVFEADEEPISEEVLEADEEVLKTDVPEDIIIEETQTEMFTEEENPINVNAVPKTPSIDELLAKAAAAGEQPEVKKDEENEVTLLDYSDLL